MPGGSEMRPTFRWASPLPPTDALDRLARLLAEQGESFEGRRAGNHLMVTVPAGERHFWSPWAHVEVLDPGDPAAAEHGHPTPTVGCVVRGRFSPNPAIWTGYMLAYLALATLIVFAAVFGYAQFAIERPPSALLVIPACLAIAGGMWVASLVGQRLAREQIEALRGAIAGVLDLGPPPPGEPGPGVDSPP